MLKIHPPVSPENAAQAILQAMQDERLSFRARGLLGLFLSHAGEVWECGNLKSLATDIANRQKALTGRASGEGQHSIHSTLQELEQAGYLARRLIGDGVYPRACIEIRDTPGAWEAVPPIEDRDRDSSVYVIGQHGNSVVKIGTTSSLQNRLRTLQSGYPLRLEVLWHTSGGWGLEQYLHRHFSDKRMEGEWFDFGDQDPVNAVSRVAFKRQRKTA